MADLIAGHITQPLIDLWSKEGDEFMMNYWLMGSPLSMATAILLVFLTVYVVAPRYAKSLAGYDLKPVMLIANGTVFGIVGMGWLIGLYLTNFASDGLRCDGSFPRDTDLRTSALKMIAFMYVMTKLLEFQRPIFASLRGSSASDHYKSLAYNMYLLGQLTMSYIGGVFYPGGPLVIWPMTDAVVMIVGYGYLVLRLATPALHPSPTWIKIVSVMRFLTSFILMVHAYLFSFTCAMTSSKLAYLLNIAFYYNAALVTAQLFSFLVGDRRPDLVTRPPLKTPCDDGNNNACTRIQGH